MITALFIRLALGTGEKITFRRHDNRCGGIPQIRTSSTRTGTSNEEEANHNKKHPIGGARSDSSWSPDCWIPQSRHSRLLLLASSWSLRGCYERPSCCELFCCCFCFEIEVKIMMFLKKYHFTNKARAGSYFLDLFHYFCVHSVLVPTSSYLGRTICVHFVLGVSLTGFHVPSSRNEYSITSFARLTGIRVLVLTYGTIRSFKTQ